MLAKKLRKAFERTSLYGVTLLGQEELDFSLMSPDPWPPNINIDLDYFVIMCKHETTQDKEYLSTFEWLREFKSSTNATSRIYARELIEYWIKINHSHWSCSWSSNVWKPDVMGYRIWNWISMFDFYGASANDQFKVKLEKSLTQQFKQLLRSWNDQGNTMLERFRALKGIIGYHFISKSYRPKINIWFDELEKVLNEEFFEDGGHKSRNAFMQLLFLRDLIDLRSILSTLDVNINFLHKKVSQIASIVRLFRHGDGNIAQFNGTMSMENHKHFLPETFITSFIDMCLSLSDLGRRPPMNAEIMGYMRCVNKSGIFLLSTKPSSPASVYDTSTGLFNFEWSYDRQLIITRSEVLIETDDCDFLRADIDESTTVQRTNNDEFTFMNCEYQSEKFDYSKQIYISGEKTNLRGEETFILTKSGCVAIRFVLAPDIEVVPIAKSTKSVFLKLNAINVHSLKKFSKVHSLKFSATGCQELIYQPANEDELHSLVLLGCLDPHKPTLIKWSIDLNQ